jgi:hypothetical protein
MKMKTVGTISITAAVATILLLGATDSSGQDSCDRGGNHTIQVVEGSDGLPELSYRGGSAEDIHVCNGDQVQWVLTGSDREYFVDFMGDAPFPGAAKRGSSDGVVSVTIDAESRAYEYGVNFAGSEAFDPRIIVD